MDSINFEEVAKQSAKKRRKSIIIIPDNCKINPIYLGFLENSEFVTAFKEMQELIINIYSDVEKSPYDWGYPGENNTKKILGTAYNRISDFFCAIASGKMLDDGTLIVDQIKIDKVELIISRLSDFGFEFTGYDKKADSFCVSYSKDPLILHILCVYAKSQDKSVTYNGAKNVQFASFSYRWVEDPDEQKHEPIFLVKMDISPKPIQDIQYWLYDKAKENGYSIDIKKPFDKNFINYTKGSKQFILVGERDFDGVNKMAAKVIFRKIFSLEPEKVSTLAKNFPDVFGNSYASCHRCWGRKSASELCSMRICYNIDDKYYENCAYQSFWFFDPTLDTFKEIYELFIIENKIRKCINK